MINDNSYLKADAVAKKRAKISLTFPMFKDASFHDFQVYGRMREALYRPFPLKVAPPQQALPPWFPLIVGAGSQRFDQLVALK
jgi:hypothetical protein